MTTQFRDTQFGHLVRFLFGNKTFQYPDEVDPLLWRASLQRNTISTSTRSGEQSNSMEKPKDQNYPIAKGLDTQGVASQDLCVNHVIEDGKDIYLIDWYGPDDPENPQNWSSSWKLLIGFEICLLNFSVYIASSIYTAGELSIMENFGASETVATLGLALFTMRAKRLRKATGDDRLSSQSEIDAAHHTMRDDLVVLGRAFTLTFSEPIVFFMDLYTALLYGVLFIWFESFPLVFGEIYGFNLGEQGLAFLGIFVGGVITVPLYLVWVKYGIIPRFTKPTFKPEMVLPPTFFGSASLPVCLFWYGWSARESVHWIMPIIGAALFAIGIVTVFNAVLNYLGISYPPYTASIFAGNALFRASFGAIFPLFARQLFRRLGIGPGNSLLGGIATCDMTEQIIRSAAKVGLNKLVGVQASPKNRPVIVPVDVLKSANPA
ncbi:MAG: hypothetical protein M1819_004993 [Sarea resinae]|nr:MAG: hypothetical protein M1819_004993 [Sarea resinae]